MAIGLLVTLKGQCRCPGFAPFLDIQAGNTRSSGANLGFAIFQRRQPQMFIAIDRLAPSGPHSSRTLRFPFRKPSSGPIHFLFDLTPSPRYYRTTQVIYKITAFFDNLTRALLLAIANC